MTKTLYKAGIYLLLAAITSLLFGIITLSVSSITLGWLVRFFAWYMIIKGFFLGAGAWQTRLEESHWQFLLWYGILNIITGVAVLLYPGPTMIILGFIVSINLLSGGILQMAMAVHLHREINEGGWLICSGIIALIAGLYIYLIPRIESLTILYLIAASALLVGVFLFFLALKARGWHVHTSKK